MANAPDMPPLEAGGDSVFGHGQVGAASTLRPSERRDIQGLRQPPPLP